MHSRDINRSTQRFFVSRIIAIMIGKQQNSRRGAPMTPVGLKTTTKHTRKYAN